jgi:uncharacterized protein (DUF983 family)
MFVRMTLRALIGNCPRCGHSPMFRGIFALRDRCDYCGISFENQPGDFTGAAHISATAISAFAMVLGVLTMWALKLSVWQTVALDLPVIVLVGLAVHRLIKALWMSFIVYTQALEASEQEFWF